MNEQKKETNYKEKGITLVALVVTIIILLILAGVTINLVLNNNGLLKRAQEASNMTANATKNENAQFLEYETIIDEDTSLTDKPRPTGKKITINGNEVDILSGKESLSNLYGEEVESFESIEGVNWKLFYDDEQYYFLIASDYIYNDYLSNQLTKHNGSPYGGCRAWFGTYRGGSAFESGLVTESPWNEGADYKSLSGNERNPLVDKYLKWVNSSFITTRNWDSMAMVAFMMDSDVWKDFAGEENGAFAIGGPTIELFALSYNAVPYHEEKMGTYEELTEENTSRAGYKLKIGENDWSFDGFRLNNGPNDMWIPSGESKSKGYWIASPSAWDWHQAISTTHVGITNVLMDLDYQNTNTGGGFRPIVCIPKK